MRHVAKQGKRFPVEAGFEASRFSVYFDTGVRTRGEQYVDAVRVVENSGRRLVARVQGTELYAVGVEKAQHALRVFCTCPYCDDEISPCKHVWATLVLAERRSLLDEGPTPRTLELDRKVLREAPLPAIADDSEDFDDSDFDDEEYWTDELASSRDVETWPPPGETDGWQPRTRLVPDRKNDLSWLELFSASFEPYGSGAVRAETRLRYAIVPEEIRGGSFAIYFVEPGSELKSDGTIALIPARQKTRKLEPDARAVERWLQTYSQTTYGYGPPLAAHVTAELLPAVLRELCDTGRCHVAKRRSIEGQVAFDGAAEPLRWDGAGSWRLEVGLVEQPAAGGPPRAFRIEAFLAREGSEPRPLAEPEALTASGLVLFRDLAAKVDYGGRWPVVLALRNGTRLVLAESELEHFVENYYRAPAPPALRLPEGLTLEDASEPATLVVDLKRPSPEQSAVPAEAWFDYGDLRVSLGTEGTRLVDWPRRRLIARDLEAEQRWAAELRELGFRGVPSRSLRFARSEPPLTISPRRLPAAVSGLIARGVRVEAEGRPYRSAGTFRLSVQTGIDWFDLDARLEFGTTFARLPALLRTLARKERSIVLDDGSTGMLPEEWLSRWGVLDGVAELCGDKLRFSRSALALVLALTEGAPELAFDEAFARLRRELERHGGARAVDPPAGFSGELRAYQRHGLGWLQSLERAGLGGCLADDMGLGKTVQLLALLARRRTPRKPSLIVAPRSVIDNWQREAARFVPDLRVLCHVGADRKPPGAHFSKFDLILTTYGTLLRDIERLREQAFRLVVLDEAQAIKNAASKTARAARALRSEQRLALTGTPIENHVGELWSLFDFLNPGLFASAKRLKQAIGKGRELSAASADLVRRAVRPFLLRRTKEEVAKDLPKRIEQTLYVELSPEERRLYHELAEYYRVEIGRKLDELGPERSTPHVLEALLRLRQAACHPGLLDRTRERDPSAKLEALLDQLEPVLDSGHKALVFSQFTSLLSIVRAELDERAISYEYLDGKTRNRDERIQRFQNDPDSKLFLISLKAGGVGLNLTAADYVFILDPWWNPAVEAQAIDRAHRIGQTRRVVAYRLIARGTVEEKVEQLKSKKRALVRAVLGTGEGFGGKLSRGDLELLLA
jgi:superfamily II DNA or RNA helicase